MPADGPAQHRDERLLGQPRHLADGRQSAFAQLRGGDRPDPPQPLHRQRMQEARLAPGRHHQQPVGLGHPAGHLGQEFGAGHTHRDGQPHPLADVAPQPAGDLDRRARDPLQPAHVQERLVDREALHQRRGRLEHVEHGLAGLAVGGHPRRDHHRLRTRPPGLRAAHRRPHAARLGLVAGRQHHAPAHDDRAPAEARIVALLDRGVEGVQVGVEDRDVPRHEHMFVSDADGTSA